MVEFPSISRYVFLLITIIMLAWILSACGPSHSNRQTVDLGSVNASSHFLLNAHQDEFEEVVHNMHIKSKIMDQYSNWKGVHYLLGGITKRGIDCSGFVQITFREQFNIELPRSTLGQWKAGYRIQRANLRPGDLLLFRAGSTGRHVGIYLDKNKFVHATTSSGVIISNLHAGYWKSRYREARRVLLQ